MYMYKVHPIIKNGISHSNLDITCINLYARYFFCESKKHVLFSQMLDIIIYHRLYYDICLSTSIASMLGT